jgi:hypothetical protein
MWLNHSRYVSLSLTRAVRINPHAVTHIRASFPNRSPHLSPLPPLIAFLLRIAERIEENRRLDYDAPRVSHARAVGVARN